MILTSAQAVGKNAQTVPDGMPEDELQNALHEFAQEAEACLPGLARYVVRAWSDDFRVLVSEYYYEPKPLPEDAAQKLIREHYARDGWR